MANNRFQQITGFNDRPIILIGLPIASLLTSLLLFNEAYYTKNWQFLSVCIPISFVYTGIFWWFLRVLYHRLRERFPDNSAIAKRLTGMFIGFFISFFVINWVLDALFSAVFPDHRTSPNLLVEFISALLLSALIITIYEAISFYLQLQHTIAEKADLERKNIASQLEGLRNQVNPHFLFNSLNTLVYLIPEDAEKAVRFVQQLSKVYRYVLESREAGIIPLADELEFLQAYTFLQKERFGDNFMVKTGDLSAANQLGIVPLTLQMLFENAIKHNIISTEKPLTVEVFVENNHLVVRNNLQRKNQVMDSTGVGLENIQTRYQMLTGQEVQCIVSQQYFTVLLPLVAPDSGLKPKHV